MSNNIKGITVEIGGNTGPLNTALKDVNKTSRDLQSELKEVNRQLKFNPSSTVLLNQKQELLAKQISNTKEKLETLKEAEKQAEQQFNNGEIGEDKYRAVQREVEKTETQLKSLEKQAKETSSVLGIKFENAGTKIKNTGDKISGVGQKFTPVSAAAAGVGVAAIKMADDFETGMAKVSTIADTTQVPLSQLKQSVMDLSNETGIGTSELTDGLYQTISAGVQTKDAMNVLGTAVKTAKGGFTDTSTAIDTLTSAINAYHMKASDAAKVSDTLIATQNIGKTTVGELGQSLGNVIPTAAAAGVKFTDLMGSIAELTKQGMPTSEAITGIKAAISNVIKPSSEASKTAQKLGLDFNEAHMKNVGLPAFMQEVYKKTGGNISIMSQLFGSVEGLNAVTALTGKNQKDFAKTLDGVSKAAGTTNQAFKKVESTGATAMGKAMNSMKNAAAKLGEALAPVINKISALIKSLADKLSGLSKNQLDIIAKVVLVTAVVAPLLITVGKVAAAIGSITGGIGKLITNVAKLHTWLGEKIPKAITFLAAHPMVLIILAIVAAVAALVIGIKHLWDTNKGFRTAVTSIWTGIKNTLQAIGKWFSGPFVNFFKTAVNSIKSFFTGIPAFFTGIWNGIQSAATSAWNAISSAVMAIVTPFVSAIQAPFNTLQSGLSNILNGIKSIFTGAWTLIKNVVLGIVLIFIDLITGDFTKLHSDLTGILNNIKNAFSTIWNGIKSVVTGIAKVLVGALGTIFKGGVAVLQSIGNNLKSFFSTLWSGMKSTAINMWNSLLSFFSGLPTKFSGFMKGVGNAIIHGFDSAIEFIKGLPAKMLQWGKDMIQGLIDGIKSMVGKVGDAVKGVGKKIRSFLHFSVPDEGPLVDYETWMPDFMSGLANGILSNMYKVTGAMQQVSAAVANTMLTISSGPQVQTAMAAAYGGYSVPVNVPHNSGSSTPAQSTDSGTGKVEVNQYFQGKVPSPAEHARLTRLGVQQAILKIKK